MLANMMMSNSHITCRLALYVLRRGQGASSHIAWHSPSPQLCAAPCLRSRHLVPPALSLGLASARLRVRYTSITHLQSSMHNAVQASTS